MKKRTTVLGSYDTAAYGWTLTSWVLSDPEMKTNYVERAGGDGAWDLSTVMTDGIPKYKDRNLTVTLECSKGTRADREQLVRDMVNLLDGLEWEIIPPDRLEYYLVGRLHVAVRQNDHAYAAVTVTGVCRPWLYRKRPTKYYLDLAQRPKPVLTVRNGGRLAVVPTVTVTGANADICLGLGDPQEANDYVEVSGLPPGTYKLPDMLLRPGTHEFYVTGSGELTISFREAVLR
ncbi:MAG: hypothetical protein E7439_03345 [Ruminococcaceae bacterium]|nr:hypothetical protein [Oscillospiraceae bacterium]